MKLHIKSKLLSLHHKMNVMDEDNQLHYCAISNAVSITDKTHIENAQGDKIASFHAKPISIHHVYYVEMEDGTEFSLSEELFHVKDVIDIEELGWQLRGSVFAHDYEIVDQHGRVLADSHRKWVSLHDTYCIEVYDESKMDYIVTLFVILEHMVMTREHTTNYSSKKS